MTDSELGAVLRGIALDALDRDADPGDDLRPDEILAIQEAARRLITGR